MAVSPDPRSGADGTFPYPFLIATLGVSIAIGVLVTYLGIHGQIGGGIP